MSFPYFGQKKALLKYYPPPDFKLIVEPFAGSARYACKYGRFNSRGGTKDVWINDKYKVIYDIWCWIQTATKKDIYALPKLKRKGETLADHKYLSEPERNLLGFATGVGRAQPSNKITAFACGRDGTVQLRDGLLKLVGRIDHWRITNLSYEEMENKLATWFIDPPYQFYGKHYKHNEKKIDFAHLNDWCQERRGQIIVCEAGKANWLKKGKEVLFNLLRENIARLQRNDDYTEVFYHRSIRQHGFGLKQKEMRK